MNFCSAELFRRCINWDMKLAMENDVMSNHWRRGAGGSLGIKVIIDITWRWSVYITDVQ